MRRLPALLSALSLALALAVTPSVQAATFANSDFNGRWSIHAFGVYDTKTILYYGTLSLDDTGLVTGSTNGAYCLGPAEFTGGGLAVYPNGQVVGIIEGHTPDDTFRIDIMQGWMDRTKSEITIIGTDDNAVRLMIVLVRLQ